MTEGVGMELRENERKTLIALKELGGSGEVNEISKAQNIAHAAVMRAALSLSQKKLVEIHTREISTIQLTSEGALYAEEGFPERRVLRVLMDKGEVRVEDLTHLTDIDEGKMPIVIGWLVRKGWAVLDGKKIILKVDEEPPLGSDEVLIRELRRVGMLRLEDLDEELKSAVPNLRRRRLIEVERKALRRLRLTEEGWRVIKEGLKEVLELTRLSPKLIVSGEWRRYKFRRYDVKAPVPQVWGGRRHPYLKFLDDVRMKLVAMGFKEMTGPLVELTFFNFDALFTPQDHPAREWMDIYMIKNPEYGDLTAYQSILENVKETHENGWRTGSLGWGGKFSVQESARLILRGHGTALSVRKLISEDLEVPGKYFSIVRCYRPELVDRTHLTEFNQVEGIVVGEELNLRDLLGILERFAIEIAEADDVRFRPDYFPFTEPSVELSAYKKGYGWLEFGGSGIFRPEVTKPLGIEVPVLAWGLGVDRLFMMKSGIEDIRYLFTHDLKWIRSQRLI